MADSKFKQRIKAEAGVQLSNQTASRALIINASNELVNSSVTDTELGYLSGVTSAIQTQLSSKLDKSGGQLSADLDANNFKVTNLAAPTNANDAATKNYVDTLAQGIQWKQPVKAASTADLTLSGLQTVDAVTLVANDRILVKNQAAPAQNGIYLVASGSWTRAADMNAWAEVPGAAVFVEQGTANADKGFVCTSDQGGTLGSTAINFTQFTNVLYTADGQGIELVGNQFQLELDGSTLSKSATGLKVAALGITDSEIATAAAITRSKLASGTTNHVLINDGTGVMSSEATLSASRGGLGTSAAAFTGVVKAATGVFSASTIVDADVSASAAITRTKLANGTANHVIINSGTGALSSEAQLGVSRGGTGVNGSTATNGQLLIGNGSGYTLATLTQGSGITITNGSGSISIAANSQANPNDIPDTNFTAANNQTTPANVTGLAFANANIRGFEALVAVTRIAGSNVYEIFTIRGVQKASVWDIDVTSTGDESGIVFSITNAGQIQYTSSNLASHVSSNIRFRAQALAV